MSPRRKRAAAAQLQAEFAVSERRACQVIDQPRSSQRYQAKIPDDEPVLIARILELVREHPRYGYRMITAKLRREGWRVNLQADLPTVASRGAESAAEEAEKAASGYERERLLPAACRAHEPRVVLGLHLRPHDQRQPAEVAHDRGRVHAGEPCFEVLIAASPART